MQMIPGKLDCTRIRRPNRSLILQFLCVALFLCVSPTVASCSARSGEGASQKYPELARLGISSYCTPYFGFRLTLPGGFKPERIHLPVQPPGRHMLLALHLQRLDRSADLFISAFEDNSKDPAQLAAKVRVQQARHGDLIATGPNKVSIHGRAFHRLHIVGDAKAGDETSFYFDQRGYVVHFAVFSHEPDLASAVAASIERLEFFEPGASCPAAASSDERVFYGPALPTDLVDATIRANPGTAIPSGEFAGRTFHSPALGVRVDLPPRFQPLPLAEAYRVTELMRDPTDDPDSSDRRRVLFRACSRVLFAAADPQMEITSEVHPGLAVVALPKGCVPDLLPPASADERDAAAEFATMMARTLGVTLATRGHVRAHRGAITSSLDGTLPYHVRDEPLSRRASLRVSATANGDWIILVYTVAPSPAAEHEIESHILLSTPRPAKPVTRYAQ